MSFHGKELSLSEPTRRVHLTIPILYKDFIIIPKKDSRFKRVKGAAQR